VTTPQKHDYSSYTSGCRCSTCREANRVHHLKARTRRRANPTLADAAGHGKENTYNNYACRCDDCRTAHAAAQRVKRAKRRTADA
jgi:hypothetical protein